MTVPSEEARRRFAGKRVTVIGLAREGLSLVRFLSGAGAQVTANDRATEAGLAGVVDSLRGPNVRFVLGSHPTETLLETDCLFVSPGVPQELEPVRLARERGIAISSETQLFFELCRGRIVGITGSSGKTTTTALVGEMIRRSGRTVHVGGNIGVTLLEQLDEIAADDWVVREMSSFQLETLPYSPPVAAILNLTPNHLDRHKTMERYVEAKANMFRHQKPEDVVIFSAEDLLSREFRPVGRTRWFSMASPVDGGYLDGNAILLRRGASVEQVCLVSDLKLRGRHNIANVLAAVTIAGEVGVSPEEMRSVVLEFRGVPHRLEIVAEMDGVTYCNDSIATAPERAMASIRAFEEPVVLIAGGRNKKLPMGDWAELIRERVNTVVLMGEATKEIETAILAGKGGKLPSLLYASSMQEAVELSRRVARPGDVVLLAPGGTSFDMYHDFEERGERFREAVRALSAGQKGEVRS